MNNTRYKNTKIALVVLVILAIILFVLQNFGMPFLKEESTTQYYRANKDIEPFTELTSDLFTAVTVDINSVPDGFITNFSEVEGSYAKGPIYKNDYLTSQMTVSSNEEEDCIYTMEITADYSGPLVYDTYIDIYTLSKDNVPELLFSNKRLYSAGTQVLATDGTTTEQSVDKKYIKVTRQEMLEYYSKLKSYSFIILPVAEAYIGTNSIDASFDVKAPADDDSAAKVETFEWTVKDGESWESIASDWGTDADTLKGLNRSVDELSEGIKILIPEQE